jgi:hypothetical protein
MDPHKLADRYEELRARAMGHGAAADRAMGFALFIRRGMPAWMAAWAQCLPAVSDELPKRRDLVRDLLPYTLRGRVTALLTEMALSNRWGV